MGYTSDIKKYYEKLGDTSDEKVVKDYTTELADLAEDLAEDKKSSKFTYPHPEEIKQTREKHRGSF